MCVCMCVCVCVHFNSCTVEPKFICTFKKKSKCIHAGCVGWVGVVRVCK